MPQMLAANTMFLLTILNDKNPAMPTPTFPSSSSAGQGESVLMWSWVSCWSLPALAFLVTNLPSTLQVVCHNLGQASVPTRWVSLPSESGLHTPLDPRSLSSSSHLRWPGRMVALCSVLSWAAAPVLQYGGMAISLQHLELSRWSFTPR